MVLYVVFFPVMLLSSLVFLTFNLLMLPFTFIKVLLHKSKLVVRNFGAREVGEWIKFAALGVPMMMVSQGVDFWLFVKQTFNWDVNMSIKPIKLQYISLPVFNAFHELVGKLAESSDEMRALDLVQTIGEKTEYIKHIRIVLFGFASFETKDFVNDHNKMESQRMIDNYNLLKAIIWSCVMDKRERNGYNS